MTLRLRLLLIGVSMLLLWGAVAIWMLHDLEHEMMRTLDKLGLRVTTADRLNERNALTAIKNAPQAPGLQPLVNSVRPEIRRGPDTVRISVCDQGPGLSNEALVLAKQRFWRRCSGRGGGLGLSIVVAIAERFGGLFELLQRPKGKLEVRWSLAKRQL